MSGKTNQGAGGQGDVLLVPANGGEGAPDPGVSDTGSGFITGVTPAQTPEQIRQAQQAQQAHTQPQQGQQTNGQRLFTAEEVEKFRQEEKAKLYPRIEEMSKTVERLAAERDAEIAAREAEVKRAEEEAKAKAREDMDVRQLLEEQRLEFEQRIKKQEEQAAFAFAALQKERELQALEQTRAQLLDQFKDQIAPEMQRFVRGDSPEELEQSLREVIESSSALIQNIQAAQQNQWRGMVGPRVTQPGIGPMEEQQEQRALTAQDINKMSMQEYRQYRGILHQAASQQFHSGR